MTGGFVGMLEPWGGTSTNARLQAVRSFGVSKSDRNGDRRDLEPGSLYVCSFCHSPFRLPQSVRVSIRYVGRTPEVECPACSDRPIPSSRTDAL